MKKYIALVLSVIKYMQKCYRNSAMSENIFEDHRKNGLNSKLKRTKAILSRIFGDHVRVIGGLMCPMWDQTVGRYSKRVGINAIHQKKNVKPFILNRDHILPQGTSKRNTSYIKPQKEDFQNNLYPSSPISVLLKLVNYYQLLCYCVQCSGTPVKRNLLTNIRYRFSQGQKQSAH